MEILLTIVHLLACFILVIVVLLQKGKGADLAGAFGGGGSQTALGVRSATQLIHKMTIAAAVFFMITSYTLGLIQSAGKSLAEQVEQVDTGDIPTDEAGDAETPAAGTDEDADGTAEPDSNSQQPSNGNESQPSEPEGSDQ